MAHNLFFDNAAGRHAHFNVRTPAWHKLGVTVPDALNKWDAISTALLNWEVEKHQFSSPLTGDPVESWGIFRSDTKAFLGAVGSNYTIIQNPYAFSFVDAILEADGNAHYVSAGALGKGERIWALAKVNGTIKVNNTDDEHETYLLFTTSHDGSLAATCKITTTRVVCQNTLTQALGEKGAHMRVKHTQSAQAKLLEAQRLMTGVHQQIEDIERKFNELATRKITLDKGKMFDNIMNKLFGVKDYKESTRTLNKVSEIAKLFHSNDHGAIPQIEGSAYSLLNAITEYQDHFANFRRTDGKENLSGDTIRSENALFGVGAQVKENALDIIIRETEDAPRYTIPARPMIFTPPAMAAAPQADNRPVLTLEAPAPMTPPPAPAGQGSLLDAILADMN